MTDLTDTLEEEQIDQIVIEFVHLRVKDLDRLTGDLIDEMNALDRRHIHSTIDEYDSNLYDELVTKVTS
tara:strand:- start:653 stop:859 length:207 start_codon:yes stop_codon:yes gene_type:complete